MGTFLRADKPNLGNNTESSPPPRSMRSVEQSAARETRTERYQYQASARQIFFTAGVKKGLEYPANFHRTAKCTHVRIAGEVGVNRSKEHNKAFYTGLAVCGNVWTCPVCAAKVQERRRAEIAQAFDYAYGGNHDVAKKVIMVTFTFPHYRFQGLKDLITLQADAYKRLRRGSPWGRLKGSVGYGGLIRSLEVTYGDNGWHPHTHEAWIVDSDVDVERLRERMAERWLKTCKRVGLCPEGREEAFLEHSVHITDNCRTSDYLAKQDDSRHWGADRELAKATSKMGKKSGCHPFAFLNEYSEGIVAAKAERLFLEYARAMRGRAQLFWSRGLKDQVGVDDLTDEEIAAKEDDCADVLGRLTIADWDAVTKAKNGKTIVLDLAEVSGWDAIAHYIRGLGSGT